MGCFGGLAVVDCDEVVEDGEAVVPGGLNDGGVVLGGSSVLERSGFCPHLVFSFGVDVGIRIEDSDPMDGPLSTHCCRLPFFLCFGVFERAAVEAISQQSSKTASHSNTAFINMRTGQQQYRISGSAPDHAQLVFGMDTA